MKRSCLSTLLYAILLFALVAGLFPPTSAVAAPATPTDVPTRFVTDIATGLTVTSTMLYYHTNCGGDFYPERSFLRRTRTDVSAVETRYAPAECTHGAVASENVAVDASDVYWIESNGRILRQPTSGSSLSPVLFAQTHLASVFGYPSCCWIAVDGSYVYWNEGSTVYRKAKSGGDPQLIYTETAGSIRELRGANNGSILFLAGRQLRLLRPTGSSYSVSTVATNVASYVLASDRIYYGSADTTDFYLINSVRADDLGDFQNHYVSDRIGRPRLTNLAVDGANLYWSDKRGSTASGPIWRKALSGDSAAVQLTGYRSDVNRLQVAGNKLFWTDYFTGIWTVGTGVGAVAPPTGDLELVGIHVTQGIQTDDNRVPLVGEKATIVRVFVRGTADTNGPWTDVVAHMNVDGDVTRYEGGPLALPSGSSDRYGLADSFTFLLSPAATAPGSRTMRVSISAFSGRAEGNPVNNSATVSLMFGPAQRIVWYGMTYGNTNTTCSGAYAPDGMVPSFSRFEPHRQYTENTLPVSSLTILPVPGNPQRLFDNSGTCTAYESAHTYLAMYMARYFASGGRRAYLLTPESTGYHGWCCTGDAGNLVARGQDLLSDPGPTMAHEIAHSYGGIHTFEDTNYPRASGSMGNYLGFRLLSNEATPRPQVIRGETDAGTFFGDLMSYTWPFWISPYTFCRLSDSISGGTIRCPAGLDGFTFAASAQLRAAGAGGGQAQTYLYVSGYLDANDKMVLLPFELAEVSGSPTGPQGNTYQLTLETGDGVVLPGGSYTFNVEPPASDEANNPQPHTQRTFGFYVPWNPQTQVIHIRENGQLLGERVVTPESPQFTAFNFEPGPAAKGVLTVNWDAIDPDGDPLTFSVWYSPDGGAQWIPVHVNDQANTTKVDFDTLPAGEKAMLRVVASDGVNTTSLVGPAFNVPRHAPVVSTSASLDAAANFVLATSTVYDAENGAIDDPAAYRWTSNWQGEVGRGRWLTAASLTPGQHTLTLAVTDNDGDVGTATLDVVVPNRPEASATVVSPSAESILTLVGLPALAVTFPAGAVSEPIRLTAAHIPVPDVDLPGIVGSMFEIDATAADGRAVTQFAQPFDLTASYDDALLNGADEKQLALFFEDEKTGFWTRIGGTVDSEQNTVTAHVNHLTRFALVVTPANSTVASSYLYLPSVRK